MPDDQQNGTANLHAFLRVLLRRWWVVALCTLLVPALAYGLASSQPEEYTASSSLLLRSADFSQQLLEIAPEAEASAADPAQAATDLDLISVREVAERTAAALDGDVTADAVAAGIEAEADGESNVVSITATQPSADLAAAVANTYAEEYIRFRRASDRDAIEETSRVIEAELEQIEGSQPNAANRDRRDRLVEAQNELALLGDLQTGSAEVVEQAQAPGSPSSQDPVTVAVLGIGFGLLIGIGLALLLELLSRRLNEPQQLQGVLDIPVLGAIPHSRALRGDDRHFPNLPEQDREAFQMLRANLRHLDLERPLRSVLVTSAEPRDGKSTIAWNLAAAAAEAGVRVLLLEAELRRPSFVARFGAPSSPGLTRVLTGNAGPSEVTDRVEVGQRVDDGRDTAMMSVIVAGSPPPNPIDLLESGRMRALVDTLSHQYELLVIDTPPVGRVADALALVKAVSGVIVVSRMRKNTLETAAGLRAQLDAIGAPVLGAVINDVSAGNGYNRYGYSPAQSAESRR